MLKLEFKWYVYIVIALLIYMAFVDVHAVGGLVTGVLHLGADIARALDHGLRAVQGR